jgi:hypothetical protein
MSLWEEVIEADVRPWASSRLPIRQRFARARSSR